MDRNIFKNKKLRQIVKYLVWTVAAIYALFLASSWLDTAFTRFQGGQILQGGTFWKALSITFRDASRPDRRVPVDNVSFRNVDRFLPITVIVRMGGRDSTYFAGTQEEWVNIAGTNIDSLVIRTRNASHSAVIDDLSFQIGGRRYLIDFDHYPQGASIPPNTQLLECRTDGVLVTFDADNAIPTVMRGIDLGGITGYYISQYSGPISTAIMLALLAIPFWLVLRFAQVMGGDLSPDRFFSEQDVRAIRSHKLNVFWGGRFTPEGQDYAFEKDTELYKILASVGSETASDQTRLVEYCVDRVYMLFDEIEGRLSEAFGIAGLVAVTLGLLGTVVGMVDAFNILESTIKVGEGPAQTQLKMSHYINFALITTVVGFMGRILSISLIQKIKNRGIQIRNAMIDLIQHFNPAVNGEEIPFAAAASDRRK